MRARKVSILIAIALLPLLALTACERKITRVETVQQPATCFGCHSDTNTVLVRATWDLGHLVAAPGELQAGTQLAARAKRRAEAVERVTRLFFERRKLRVALLLAPPVDPAARAQVEVEIARLGSEIDAMTGGKLSEATP